MMSIGTVVAGRYEIRDRLGQGSQGHVLEAFDRQLGRLVALKVLPICGASAAERAERRRRFLGEARAAARLQHPGIVAVYDAGEERDEAWIAMELVIGQTLRDALRRPDRPPLREALRIGRELLDALEAAHARGVIHRDVKPCNIMLAMDAGDGHGRVRLTDFGIASLVAGQTPADTEFVGTPSVMAPEQIRGEACDERTDLWSAGVVLYELLTGAPPFAGGMPAIYSAVLARDPLPPTLLNADLPLAFDALMERALAKPIDRRFQSAREMAAAIDAAAGALLGARPVTVAPAPTVNVAARSATGSRGAATALAFLAGAAAASAGFIWRDSGWPGWPGQAVIAAVLPPARLAEAGERARITSDEVASSVAGRLGPAEGLAAIPVEPQPVDSGIAMVEMAVASAAPRAADPPPVLLAGGAAAVADRHDQPPEGTVPPDRPAAAPEQLGAMPAEESTSFSSAAEASEPAPPEAASVPATPVGPLTPPRFVLAEASPVASPLPARVGPPAAIAEPPPVPREAADATVEPPEAARVARAVEVAHSAATGTACVGRPPQVATGNHPGFGRVVLRWSQPVRYSATSRPGGLRLVFAEPFCMTVSPAAPLPRNVRAVAGAPGVIEIDAVPGSTIRHFTLDRRTVIDVADGRAP